MKSITTQVPWLIFMQTIKSVASINDKNPDELIEFRLDAISLSIAACSGLPGPATLRLSIILQNAPIVTNNPESLMAVVSLKQLRRAKWFSRKQADIATVTIKELDATRSDLSVEIDGECYTLVGINERLDIDDNSEYYPVTTCHSGYFKTALQAITKVLWQDHCQLNSHDGALLHIESDKLSFFAMNGQARMYAMAVADTTGATAGVNFTMSGYAARALVCTYDGVIENPLFKVAGGGNGSFRIYATAGQQPSNLRIEVRTVLKYLDTKKQKDYWHIAITLDAASMGTYSPIHQAKSVFANSDNWQWVAMCEIDSSYAHRLIDKLVNQSKLNGHNAAQCRATVNSKHLSVTLDSDNTDKDIVIIPAQNIFIREDVALDGNVRYARKYLTINSPALYRSLLAALDSRLLLTIGVEGYGLRICSLTTGVKVETIALDGGYIDPFEGLAY